MASASGTRRARSSKPTTSASAATASSSSPARTMCSATTAFAICASPCTTCTRTKARSAATTRPATMSATPSCIRRGLTVEGNRSDGDRDHGLLLNYANGARIEGNAVVAGGEKCVFIYNSTKNVFRGNWFEGCQIGIHLTAGSERNAISGNAFIGNRTQVKYVGTRYQEWSDAGSRQLLERQPGLRPERRRRGRPALPPERPDRPGGLELPAGQAAAEQPGGADRALRAGPVPGPAARRRRRQRAAHGPARWCPLPWRRSRPDEWPRLRAPARSASATAR